MLVYTSERAAYAFALFANLRLFLYSALRVVFRSSCSRCCCASDSAYTRLAVDVDIHGYIHGYYAGVLFCN